MHHDAGLMGQTRLSLLGRPVVAYQGKAVPFRNERRFQLLAYLAFDGGWVGRDRVAALLWPNHEAAAARRNLRKIVFIARESAWAGNLQTEGDHLRWQVASDVADFRHALATGQLSEANATYSGCLLEGLDDPGNGEFSAWLDAQRAALHQQWRDAALAALPTLATAEERAATARRLIDDDPFDETALLAALTVLTADGHPNEAQGLLRDYQRRLVDELRAQPSAAVLAAAHALAQPTGGMVAPDGSRGPAAALLERSQRARDAFVGRRSEQRELLALLERPSCRVVTIFGPGGIGKSRFVREQLPELVGLTQADVLWIALEDLSTAEQLLLRIADVLGAQVNDANDLVAQIVAQRGQQATLLVLDNAEHLPELAAWLQPLLSGWPLLRLLLTSRARVGLPEEWLLPLAGLAVPDAESRDLEAATAFDAVRLFELRALRAQPGFELAAHLDDVIALLERVDGMPLAIEMSADWVRLLPPSEIVRELERSIDILQRDPAAQAHAGPTSMHAVLCRSWDLLAPHERQVLSAVSLFRGGFRSEAAAAVAEANWPVLAALVDRSMLTLDAQGRFGMHPLVANWAAGMVPEGERQTLALRHARFFAGWLDTLARETAGDARALAEALALELPNCVRAWQAAVANEQAELLAAMRPALMQLAEAQGRWREVGALFGAALASDAVTKALPMLRLELQLNLAAVVFRLGDMGGYENLVRAAVPLARHLGTPGPLSAALNGLGVALYQRGESAAALLHYDEAIACARHSGERRRLGIVLHNAANARKALGDMPACLALNEEALAVMSEIGNDDGVAIVLNNLGDSLHVTGELTRAREVLEAGLRHAEARALPARQQILRLSLGHLLIDLGQHAAARAQLDRAVLDAQVSGQLHVVLHGLLRLARLDLIEACPVDGLRRCREVFQRARAGGLESLALEALVLHADWHAAHGDALYAQQLRAWLEQSPALSRVLREHVRQRLATGESTELPAGFDLNTAAERLAAAHQGSVTTAPG